jgi:hypothetical protein
MRTVEVLFVIIILLSAFFITTYFAVLPSSSQAFGTNLRELSQSTLETLDAQGMLSETVFKPDNDTAWGDLQKALSASLPPNIVYNLNVYNLSTNNGVADYTLVNSISDANLGADSDASSLLVTSPDVTFTQDPQKIGESTDQNITLYILNCNNANGWWITGYTGQSLAADLYDLLSSYFTTTVLINDTDELELLLENSTSLDGTIQNAVIMNPFGEAVPIPANYTQGKPQSDEGYYEMDATHDTYSKYCYTLGVKTQQYNWTWVSIVGYPFYYVSNTDVFIESDDENGYGVHGMIQVGPAGLNAFLRGIDNKPYNNEAGQPVWKWRNDGGWWHWVYDDGLISRGSSGSIATDIDVVQFTNNALDKCNYYGIYPAPSPTASRALPTSIETAYHLSRSEAASVFELKEQSGMDYSSATTYRHIGGAVDGGALTAIGLTRIPDVRVAALALLVYYNPTIYKTVFGASGTSVLVTLQLGQQGGS